MRDRPSGCHTGTGQCQPTWNRVIQEKLPLSIPGSTAWPAVCQLVGANLCAACVSLPQPSRHLDASLSDSLRLAHPLPTRHRQGLTNHVFAHMRHGVELLLADLAGEFLLRVAMHDLVVLMQGPELLEGFATRYALWKRSRTLGVSWS